MSANPESGSVGPLAGRRVIEMAGESGAYCGKLFADLGADVVKIEPPGGDATRLIPPFWGGTPHPDRSLFFLYMNTNKRGVTLDVELPRGRELFKRLARGADVVIETFPPGYLEALGIGYEAVKAENRALVFTSITGFGQTGPYRDYRSSDLVAGALGGALYVTGDPADPPVALAGSQAHIMASAFAAASSMIALWHSGATGEGQRVDISVEEVVASVTHVCGLGRWLDDNIVPARSGTGLVASIPSGAYPCTDGMVYLLVNRHAHWQALAQWIHEVTGNEGILDPMFEGPSARRFPYRDILDGWIADLTSRFSVGEVYHEGQRRHIAFTPVNTAKSVIRDPHLARRNYFVDVEHGEEGRLRYPGAPYRFPDTPWRIRRPAPAVGRHNEEVYREELGLTAEELAALAEAAVI